MLCTVSNAGGGASLSLHGWISMLGSGVGKGEQDGSGDDGEMGLSSPTEAPSSLDREVAVVCVWVSSAVISIVGKELSETGDGG